VNIGAQVRRVISIGCDDCIPLEVDRRRGSAKASRPAGLMLGAPATGPWYQSVDG
jgi:hypothetical protein